MREREGEAPAEPPLSPGQARQEPRPPEPRPLRPPSPGGRLCPWRPSSSPRCSMAAGGWRRLRRAQSGKAAKVALIQGSLDTVFGVDRVVETLEHYRELTTRAVRGAA